MSARRPLLHAQPAARRAFAAALALAAALACGGALGQGTGREDGVRWRELSAAQRGALAPLEREWPAIDAARKQKWLEIAARFPSMPPAEQQRVQARMSEWTRMSPAERGQTRLNFQEARQVPADDRKSRWEEYQALSPEQRRQLAARAVPPPAPVAAKPRPAQPVDAAQPKSNIVPNPGHAAPPRAVAPTVVQAKPGATTTLMSERRAPPPHQQTGMPKIAATPDFVDRSTLLPQRGPQGAAVQPPPAEDRRRQ